MRLLFALISALVCVSAHQADILKAKKPTGCGGTVGTAGDFDYYVFTQSWSAQFCSSHKSYEECTTPTSYMKQNLTLHGMWPQYTSPRVSSSNLWPQCCSSQYGTALNHTVINELLPSLSIYWPDEQDPLGKSDTSLWGHEWTKHGTCSGLSPYDYFSDAITLMESTDLITPEAISTNIGSSVSRILLEIAYNHAPCNGSCLVGLSCTGGYLSEVTTCWSRDLKRMNCPAGLIKTQCPDEIQIRGY